MNLKTNCLEMNKEEILSTIYRRLGMDPFMDLVPLSRIEQAIEADKKFKNWAIRVGALDLINQYKESTNDLQN